MLTASDVRTSWDVVEAEKAIKEVVGMHLANPDYTANSTAAPRMAVVRYAVTNGAADILRSRGFTVQHSTGSTLIRW
jgi:hypothetical protein